MMKAQLLLCFLTSTVSAWRVDRRCLEEGEILVGDEVGKVYSEENYEAIFLDDESFDWENLTAYDFKDYVEGKADSVVFDYEDEANLRGSVAPFFGNRSANAVRKLEGGRTFNLKLTWKRGACWQDEWIERKWCMSCRRSCNSGDVLELEKCSRNWKQRFQWKSGRLKVASKNMCLTKSGGLRLRACGGSNQQFRGFQNSGGFELKPSGSFSCLSQHHHPKAGEIIELTNCALAAQHNTNKWNVYWPTGSGGGGGGGGDDNDNDKDDDKDDDGKDNGGGGSLTKRGKACSSSNQCSKCQGDCDKDSDCKGNMKCRQRYGKTALSPISGCSGTGKKGVDYCS